MQQYSVFVPRLLPKEEFLAPGYRSCPGCGETLIVRMVTKALGRNVIVTNATGCLEIVTSPLPTTSWRVPWIHTLFENTAAVASGIESGLKILKRKGKLGDKKIKVVAFAGDGATADIGLQALSGAMERGHDFMYVCFDNEAYMNTGVQRSSSTPYGASTTTSPVGRGVGQITWKKNVPAIAVAHNIPYVATASPSYPFDLMQKAQKALNVNGPAYLHVLSPCPPGWGTPADISVKLGRLAVENGVFPLFEVVDGKYKLTVETGPLRPIKPYIKAQGRFRHLNDESINLIQERVKKEYDVLLNKIKCGA